MNDILITRDSKEKIRVIEIKYEWNETLHSYLIERKSGLYKGKMTEQPSIEINRGKAKRTIVEQVNLEYNSIIKKYLDKGYKKISSFGYNSLEEFDPEKVFPKEVVDQNNIKKPMLCKVYDPTDKKNQGKIWYASAKHDGVRAILYLKNDEIHTASRGGQDYDIPATYIRQDKYLNEIFKKYPNIMLDGEIYQHGQPLSYISGLCRLETLNEKHKGLNFHCYDIVDEKKPFKDRLTILNELKSNCPNDSKLVVVRHDKVTNNDEIMKLHNFWVNKGYEGLVIRDPDALYKCGGRNRNMQKIKLFTDDEYKIKGIVEGLRDEDMCFLMETKEGYEFKAKPIGDRNLKQWYRNNIKDLIGQLGVVKHFGMTTTDNPVPNLPVFKSIRDKKDM